MREETLARILKLLLLGAALYAAFYISINMTPKSHCIEDKIEMVRRKTEEVQKKYDNKSEMIITIPTTFKYSSEGSGYSVAKISGVRVTAYNNLPEQTNSQPNIGASNRKVFEGSIALSRDILAMKKVSYGDIACVLKTGKCYIVEDTMNKRYDNRKKEDSGWRADLFMYDRKEALKVNFKSDILIIKQL